MRCCGPRGGNKFQKSEELHAAADELVELAAAEESVGEEGKVDHLSYHGLLGGITGHDLFSLGAVVLGSFGEVLDLIFIFLGELAVRSSIAELLDACVVVGYGLIEGLNLLTYSFLGFVEYALYYG